MIKVLFPDFVCRVCQNLDLLIWWQIDKKQGILKKSCKDLFTSIWTKLPIIWLIIGLSSVTDIWNAHYGIKVMRWKVMSNYWIFHQLKASNRKCLPLDIKHGSWLHIRSHKMFCLMMLTHTLIAKRHIILELHCLIKQVLYAKGHKQHMPIPLHFNILTQSHY